MYAAETTLPGFQNLASEFDDDIFCHSHKFITCLDSLIDQTTVVSDYDLGDDLFKAPQPIIQVQPPLSSSSSSSSSSSCSNSCGEFDTINSPQQQQLVELTDIKNQEFLSDVFYECKNLLPKEAPAPLSQVINLSCFPEENVHQIPKSISSDSLNSMDWIQGGAPQLKSSFLNFTEEEITTDFGGMRRAFSEGDIKTLSDDLKYNYPLGLITEDRMQKLSRYRNKKTKRNFGRKIKYACRKALADSQPRIRGRFAKTDESDILRK